MKRTLLAALSLFAVVGLSTACDKDKAEGKPATKAEGAKAEGAKDKVATDKAATDKVATDKAATDKGPKDKAATDKVAKDTADNDKAAKDKAAADVKEAEKQARITKYMQKHFGLMTEARNALIAGSVEDFKKHMAGLAQAPAPAGLPDGWAPHFTKMVAAAEVGAKVNTIADAGDAIGAAAVACANCHRATVDTTRVFATGKPPLVTDTMKGYMKRHVWASREMWAGIFGPDDDAWANAVKVLEETPLNKAPGADKLWPKEAHALALDVAAVAKLGLAAKPEERPAIYGQFLATCASCHKIARKPAAGKAAPVPTK